MYVRACFVTDKTMQEIDDVIYHQVAVSTYEHKINQIIVSTLSHYGTVILFLRNIYTTYHASARKIMVVIFGKNKI